jgi:lysyl-tRNA synthetase class 2
MSLSSPWWDRDRHADRAPFLKARGRIKTAIRDRFVHEGFTETECGVLQTSPGNEAHLHGFATELLTPGGETQTLYLHTSPEFAAKKLLAAGETKIFEFARTFRNRERGALHHPEFTLLEWYRTGAPWSALFVDCTHILRTAAGAAGTTEFRFRGKKSDPFAEPERLTLGEAFAHYAGMNLLSLLDDRDGFAAAAIGAGIRVAGDDVWADIFSRVLVEKIEPHLGIGRPTVLCEYPASEAALARRTEKDPRVSERFELYVCGIEIANGFGELTDAAEQRTRFESEMTDKRRVYGETYPIDEDFLAALTHMPDAAGCALGFDRLVMLATGAEHIEQVIWTPVP